MLPLLLKYEMQCYTHHYKLHDQDTPLFHDHDAIDKTWRHYVTGEVNISTAFRYLSVFPAAIIFASYFVSPLSFTGHRVMIKLATVDITIGECQSALTMTLNQDSSSNYAYTPIPCLACSSVGTYKYIAMHYCIYYTEMHTHTDKHTTVVLVSNFCLDFYQNYFQILVHFWYTKSFIFWF